MTISENIFCSFHYSHAKPHHVKHIPPPAILPELPKKKKSMKIFSRFSCFPFHFSIAYFSPVVLAPSINSRWKIKKNPTIGNNDNTDIAKSCPYAEVPVLSRKVRKAIGIVYNDSSLIKINCVKKSLHVQINVKIAVVTSAGSANGIMIRQ